MNKRLILALLAALLVTTSTVLLAQAPPEPPPNAPGGPQMGGTFDPATAAQFRVQHLTKMLSLSAAQQQQATTIFTNAAKAGAQAREELEAAHTNLAAAVKSNETETIDAISARIGNLTAQMTAIHAKAQAAFVQILTPDQQTKLANFEAQRREHHRPMMFEHP